MLDDLLAQARVYVSSRYLQWLLAAVGLLIGMFVIHLVDKHLGKFFSKVEYDRTLEILCQRSVKIFLWVVLVSLIAGNLGFNVSGFIAGLSVTGFVVGFAVKDILANLAAGMFILIKRPFTVGEMITVAGVTGEVMEVNLAACVVFPRTTIPSPSPMPRSGATPSAMPAGIPSRYSLGKFAAG